MIDIIFAAALTVSRPGPPAPSDPKYQQLGGIKSGKSIGWPPTLGQVQTGDVTIEEELKDGGQLMLPPMPDDELLGPGHKAPDSYDQKYINVGELP